MFIFALIVHVLAVVWWIGGLATIVTVAIPAARKMADDQAAIFTRLESRFGWHSRGAAIFVGISGFYMAGRLDLLSPLVPGRDWWLTLMIVVWLVFTLILFLVGPLFLEEWIEAQLRINPKQALTRIERLYWSLLLLSLVTIAAGVAETHGLVPP